MANKENKPSVGGSGCLELLAFTTHLSNRVMPSFTAAEAQAQLDELIDLALQGEKVFIRRGRETFELTAYTDKNKIAAGRSRIMAMMRAGEERAKRKTE